MPDNYRRGATYLTITNETDKNRFRCELAISEDDRKAFDSVCPAAGNIFGGHDFRSLLRAAARAGKHRYPPVSTYLGF